MSQSHSSHCYFLPSAGCHVCSSVRVWRGLAPDWPLPVSSPGLARPAPGTRLEEAFRQLRLLCLLGFIKLITAGHWHPPSSSCFMDTGQLFVFFLHFVPEGQKTEDALIVSRRRQQPQLGGILSTRTQSVVQRCDGRWKQLQGQLCAHVVLQKVPSKGS